MGGAAGPGDHTDSDGEESEAQGHRTSPAPPVLASVLTGFHMLDARAGGSDPLGVLTMEVEGAGPSSWLLPH